MQLREDLQAIIWKHFVDHIVPAIKRFQCTQEIDQRKDALTKEQVDVFIEKALQNQPASLVSLVVLHILCPYLFLMVVGYRYQKQLQDFLA